MFLKYVYANLEPNVSRKFVKVRLCFRVNSNTVLGFGIVLVFRS